MKFKIGDLVKCNSYGEGKVTDIGQRHVWVKCPHMSINLPFFIDEVSLQKPRSHPRTDIFKNE
jgi:hypothetical protein